MDMTLSPCDAGPEASALRYGSLLLMERPAHVDDLFSRRHPRMTRLNRAKLFAPFAALAGFEECVRRKEAEYVYRHEPDAEQARALNRKLCALHRLTANSGLARANGIRVRVERFLLCRDPDSEAYLVKGQYKTFDLGFATVEAVQAGNNKNHDIKSCVGWVITLPGGVTVYTSGDTSTTEQMAELAERDLHYAFFCCDGIYNMDMDEAIACAKTVNARHSVPYHMAPGQLFDAKRAELFDVPGKLVIPAGTEIELE